ncbi:MAG: twin-arginine translocase TatA/TatE family subunit [Candidatus Stahlbacteria bacterium]|nr:twin-arginine translocase TatA/TatE family subunit [Candidatus Stahlbacteria bacterium]
MNNIGTSELVVILIIALLVFGPKKLPEIARSIGRGIFKLKQEFNNLKDTMDEESTREVPSSKTTHDKKS